MQTNYMKNIKFKLILLFTFLVAPILLFSQNPWEYIKLGSSFDGYKHLALQFSQTDKECILTIINHSNKKNIENKPSTNTNQNNSIDNVDIRIVFPKSVASKIDKILMSFDESDVFYILDYDFIKKEEEEDFKWLRINIYKALSADFNLYFNKLDIISMFKLSKVAHFRIISGYEKYDYDFPLIGSTIAINQVFLCPYKFDYNGSKPPLFDSKILSAYSEELIDKNYYNELNYNDILVNCKRYLADKYGKYFYQYISNIKFDGNIGDSTTKIYCYTRQENLIAEINYPNYSRNATYFSGNFKLYSGNKLQADSTSLYYYYNAFVDYGIINPNTTSLETFNNLNKNEIEFYYNKVILNYKLLNYLRKDESINYYYSKTAYTLKVFTETWGAK